MFPFRIVLKGEGENSAMLCASSRGMSPCAANQCRNRVCLSWDNSLTASTRAEERESLDEAGVILVIFF
jgi:hypothetical protein